MQKILEISQIMDDYSIVLPVSDRYDSDSGILTVEKESEPDFRRQLENFAKYFQKEFKYDSIQYEANEHLHKNHRYSGFMFSEVARDKLDGNMPPVFRLFGGDCFRWREFENNDPAWVLDWIWIHPFFRHRGHFAKHWKYMMGQYGKFAVELPLSADMEKFLAKNT